MADLVLNVTQLIEYMEKSENDFIINVEISEDKESDDGEKWVFNR